MSVSGRPMFPAASAASPAARSRCATSAVVVVLPFVPVMAMQRVPDPASARNPRSISDTTGTPASRAAASGAASGGTPGDTTTPAADRILARSWRPTSTSTPASSRNSTAAAPPYGWSDASLAYTSAPSPASSFVAGTPPTMSSRNSAFRRMATVPKAPPIASAPVSPMNTWAGWALNQRNPSDAPASAPQNTVSSPAPGRKYTPTYLVQSNRPNTYAKIANAPAAIAVSPVARPSSPSVRFTAFELPVTTRVTNST